MMHFTSTPFPETLRSLESDRPVRVVLALVFVLGLSAIWLIWFTHASLPVFVASPSATLRTFREPVQLVAEADGRVVEISEGILGKDVSEGDILLTLDDRTEQLTLQENEAQMRAAEGKIHGLADELALRQRVLTRSESEQGHAIEDSRQRVELVRSQQRLAARDLNRVRVLFAQGLETEAAVQVAQAEADQAHARLRSAEEALLGAKEASGRDADELRAEMAALTQELEYSRDRVAELQARRMGLQIGLDRHVVRAPIAGRIAGLNDLAVGAMVSAGDHVASILVPGQLSAIGRFSAAEAVGRIEAGQSAHLRLDGFPWTEYGSVPLVVARVAREDWDGSIRVECELAEDSAAFPVPLQHGLQGTMIVEVEQASPLGLLLRAVGRRLGEPSGSNEANADLGGS